MGTKRDVSGFTGPCSVGVQLCGALFGTILSYMASVLLGRASRGVILLTLATGVTFGILGSQVASPLDIRAVDFCLFLFVTFSVATMLCWPFDTDVSSLLNIVAVALLTSAAASSLQNVAVFAALMMEHFRYEAAGTLREDVQIEHQC